MTFYNYFKAISVLMAALVGFSSAAKIGSGKIADRIGEATLQKGSQGDWKEARNGMTVKQSDRIRTLAESRVVITLPDGSSISIEENSIVELSELLSEDGKNKFAADIKSGKMKFDIQKQGNSQSSFKFKTGTATAAIRGTVGYVGSSNGKQFLSVRSGLVDYSIGNKVVSVKGGQTAVTSGEDVSVYDFVGSGDADAFKELDAIIGDSTISLDSLSKVFANQDQEFKAALQSISDSLRCNFTPIPDTIQETSITIKGVCAKDIVVEANNKKITSDGSEIQFNMNWAGSAVGEKKFPITCYLGRVSKECGFLTTYFKPASAADSAKTDSISAQPAHTPLQISTKSVNVCTDGKALIEGTFDPSDPTASLVISIGNVHSGNLVPGNISGQFSHTMTVSDQRGNWNEKTATVIYTSNIYGTEKETVSLDVDKHCPGVNINPPTIKLVSVDSISCKAKFAIGGAKDDIVVFTPSIDGAPGNWSESSSDGYTEVNLTKGLHDYTFLVEDLAGNKNSISKSLGCYPRNVRYSIQYSGKRVEPLRIPPPPKDYTASTFRNLHFSVNGLFQNNPIYIKQITITQQGKASSTILKGTDIRENSFDYQVELTPGQKSTRIDIKVEMKNGTTISAYKIYEVN